LLFPGHLEACGPEIRGDGRRFSGVIGGRWKPEENGMAGEADLMRNVLLEACTHHVFHVVQHVDKGFDQTTR